MRKAVRLSDIAKRLDVSTVTVSNALAEQKGVSEELRDKIKKTAAEMGYRTRTGPVVVEKKKAYNIGVIISDRYLGPYPSFYWKIYQELSVAARSKNCMLVFEVLGKNAEDHYEMPLFIQENKVDGLIIIGELNTDYLKLLISAYQMPVVFLDFVKKDIEMDAVVTDNFYGMYHMVNYLIKNGHKEIAYVGTVLSSNSITDRYFGYCKALMENHLPMLDEWVIDDRTMEGVIGNIKLPEKMPTAFACNCDVSASEVIKLLNMNGYRVPEDVSVVGFDNYIYEGLCDVKITTYEVNIEEMVKSALDKIIRHLGEKEAYVPGTSIVVGKVVVKESVKSMTL